MKTRVLLVDGRITRSDMIRAGHSPSVRLFEAAACGVPVISDPWDGLDAFFRPGEEIFVSRSTRETLEILDNTTDAQRKAVGERAREKVLARRTAAHRAAELEQYALERRNGCLIRSTQDATDFTHGILG